MIFWNRSSLLICCLEMFLLYSGKIFVNEERKAYEEAARLLKQQVAVIGSKSKLLPSITIEDNIFLFFRQKTVSGSERV